MCPLTKFSFESVKPPKEPQKSDASNIITLTVPHWNASNMNVPHVSPRLCTTHDVIQFSFHASNNQLVSYHGVVGLTIRGEGITQEWLHWTWIYKNLKPNFSSYLEQVPYSHKSHLLLGLYPTPSSLLHYLDNYPCKWLLTI